MTAVELDSSIAKFYSDMFPDDEVIIGDCYEYLLEHYNEYDFIWASFPCPTHSRARFWSSKPNDKVKPVYPDLRLYEGILFLQNYFDGLFVVENVVPYYEPLINPSAKIGRHMFWSNFTITTGDFKEADIKNGNIEGWSKLHGVDISKYKFSQRRDKVLRNCVHPDLGLHIYNCMQGKYNENNRIQLKMF